MTERAAAAAGPEPRAGQPRGSVSAGAGAAAGLRPCPYRSVAADASGRAARIACEAAGGLLLGEGPGAVDAARPVCDGCRLPDLVEAEPKPCLYLVPVRVPVGSRHVERFSCRWFYPLYPKQPREAIWMQCAGCPYWFPRPKPESEFRFRLRYVRPVLDAYAAPEQPRTPLPRPASPRLPPAPAGSERRGLLGRLSRWLR